MSFQVCVRDEYNQTSNVTDGRCTTIEEAVNFSKKAVTEDNMNNALTFDEKVRHWTSYYLELLDDKGEEDKTVVYSGQGVGAKHFVSIVRDDTTQQHPLEETDAKVRVYIGSVENNNKNLEPVYAKDTRGNEIVDFKHRELLDKAVYYIKSMP